LARAHTPPTRDPSSGDLCSGISALAATSLGRAQPASCGGCDGGRLSTFAQAPFQRNEQDKGDQVKDELADLVDWGSGQDDDRATEHVCQDRAEDQGESVTVLPAFPIAGEIPDDQQRQCGPGQADRYRNEWRGALKRRRRQIRQRDEEPPEQCEDEGDWPQ
jgi:hypothetical protein